MAVNLTKPALTGTDNGITIREYPDGTVVREYTPIHLIDEEDTISKPTLSAPKFSKKQKAEIIQASETATSHDTGAEGTIQQEDLTAAIKLLATKMQSADNYTQGKFVQELSPVIKSMEKTQSHEKTCQQKKYRKFAKQTCNVFKQMKKTQSSKTVRSYQRKRYLKMFLKLLVGIICIAPFILFSAEVPTLFGANWEIIVGAFTFCGTIALLWGIYDVVALYCDSQVWKL